MVLAADGLGPQNRFRGQSASIEDGRCRSSADTQTVPNHRPRCAEDGVKHGGDRPRRGIGRHQL